MNHTVRLLCVKHPVRLLPLVLFDSFAAVVQYNDEQASEVPLQLSEVMAAAPCSAAESHWPFQIRVFALETVSAALQPWSGMAERLYKAPCMSACAGVMVSLVGAGRA